MRKIITITAVWIPPVECSRGEYVVTALCDDGTLWERDNIGNKWSQVEGIPQPALSEAGWRTE